MDTRKGLYKHILLSGGSTMFPGLPTRIEMDLKKKFDEEIKAGKRAESAKAAIFIDVSDIYIYIIYILHRTHQEGSMVYLWEGQWQQV